MKELILVNIIDGELYPFLKDVDVAGRLSSWGDEEEKFSLLGCIPEHEEIFYKGILEHDKKYKYIGFKTVEEVEEYWLGESYPPMIMRLDLKDIKIKIGGIENVKE